MCADFVPSEKGTTIRQPSTANLMLDSADRNANVYPLANAFFINKTNSILNGFFTRIATAEVVLEWQTPNINPLLSNNTITIDLSGTSTGTSLTTETAPTDFYTQAALLNWLVTRLNARSAGLSPAPTWSINNTTNPGTYALVASANVDVRFSGPIANALFINASNYTLVGPTPPAIPGIQLVAGDLRPFRYLDFISAQLTYNQDLKDSSTSAINRDVLCRWYMAWDTPPSLDAYGFPILMGYTPFVVRRLYNPPKQIRWDARQPIGQLGFEIYTDQNVLAPFSFNSNWLMTLQVSEV
jgi:hypothetical protein